MTWNTRPVIDGAPGPEVGPVDLGQTVDFDVTQTIAAGGDGLYCFAITSTSSDGVDYYSREAFAGGPNLVLDVTP